MLLSESFFTIHVLYCIFMPQFDLKGPNSWSCLCVIQIRDSRKFPSTTFFLAIVIHTLGVSAPLAREYPDAGHSWRNLVKAALVDASIRTRFGTQFHERETICACFGRQVWPLVNHQRTRSTKASRTSCVVDRNGWPLARWTNP